MFDPNGVVFKGNKEAHHVRYASPEQAALVAALAEVGIRGHIEVPKSAKAATKAACSGLA